MKDNWYALLTSFFLRMYVRMYLQLITLRLGVSLSPEILSVTLDDALDQSFKVKTSPILLLETLDY